MQQLISDFVTEAWYFQEVVKILKPNGLVCGHGFTLFRYLRAKVFENLRFHSNDE